ISESNHKVASDHQEEICRRVAIQNTRQPTPPRSGRCPDPADRSGRSPDPADPDACTSDTENDQLRIPNCISCHVSVQGRGLLNSYGRGIEIAQSYSKKDLTAILFGRTGDTEDPRRFGNVLADFLLASRLNQRIDSAKTDPTLAALYRQVIFLGENDALRINTEVGFLDSGLPDTALGPNRTAIGGDIVFLKKALLEWRFEQNGSSGKEIAVGRDYLPLGLQIDDYTTFILHLQRSGVYDFPLQLKYFLWNEKSLGSIYAYAPTFQEPEDDREYGGGFLYERYPTNMLALGVQGLAGIGNES